MRKGTMQSQIQVADDTESNPLSDAKSSSAVNEDEPALRLLMVDRSRVTCDE